MHTSKRDLPAAPPGWPVAVAATLGMSVSYIDRQTLAAIAPAVRAALHIDHAEFGWLISAFSMTYLVGAPVAGVLVDRVGARRGFALAVVAWSLVSGAHAFATSFAMLFALRVLLGAAEAPSFPAAAQAIRRSMPGARRPAAYGLLFTGSSIGAMVAAPAAVWIAARHGFRAAFVITAAVGTAWIPLWLAATRKAGLGPAGAGAPKGAAASDAPVRTVDVAKSAPVLRTLVAVVGSAPAIMFVLNWTSQYLVEGWGVARADVGGYLVFPPLLFDLGAVGFGWLASQRSASGHAPRDLFAVATLLAACLALAPLAPSPAIAMAALSVSAAGGGGVYVLVTADMLARVPASRTSTAGGLAAAAQSLAHIIASPLTGWTIDRTGGYVAALVGLGLLVVPTSLAFALWRVDPVPPAGQAR